MKPFARIKLSSVLSSVALAKGDALRRGMLVSSLAREGMKNRATPGSHHLALIEGRSV